MEGMKNADEKLNHTFEFPQQWIPKKMITKKAKGQLGPFSPIGPFGLMGTNMLIVSLINS